MVLKLGKKGGGGIREHTGKIIGPTGVEGLLETGYAVVGSVSSQNLYVEVQHLRM